MQFYDESSFFLHLFLIHENRFSTHGVMLSSRALEITTWYHIYEIEHRNRTFTKPQLFGVRSVPRTVRMDSTNAFNLDRDYDS